MIVNTRIEVAKKDNLTRKETENSNISWNTGVDGEKIWMGRVVADPSAESGAQHHKQSETVHYVFQGKATVHYGKEFEKSVILNEGDFIYIPPYQPYIFQNPSSNQTLDFITAMVPSHQIVHMERNEKVDIPEGLDKEEALVVRASDLDDSTNQTQNMPRRTGVQSPNLWIGRVTGAPAKDSGAHHHGIAETAGFIISGTTRLLYGEGYEDFEELSSGDFLRVPPFLPHIERNVSDTNTIEFVTARNPKNIVTNLED